MAEVERRVDRIQQDIYGGVYIGIFNFLQDSQVCGSVSSRISMAEYTPASSTFFRTPRYANPHRAAKNGPQNKENGILRYLLNELIEVFDVIVRGMDGSPLD
jgi:hypothetical protein